MAPRSWVPSIFFPDYTWPQPTATEIMQQAPAIPAVSGPRVRRVWGLVHRVLARFSEVYCSWCGIEFTPPIYELPFGLILKWSDRTRVEEAIATQMARAAGMPAPKILCYGEHSYDSSNNRVLWPISILMTRLPGWPLCNSGDPFIVEEEVPWSAELQRCIDAMRQWTCPFENKVFTSIIGTSVTSSRIPMHEMGPFKSHVDLHEGLLHPASSRSFTSTEAYQATMTKAREVIHMPHRSVFTHGDLKAHNILVDEDNCLSGFLDWECAGWCPEYWDFTTAMRYGQGSWWYQAMSSLGGNRYLKELECDRAVNDLTIGSYVW